MDPIASAGKKPVTEETLHSLGWTFHVESQTWNFHGTSRPCLSSRPALLDEILKTMYTVLGRSMHNIEKSMTELGVPIPDRKGYHRQPVEIDEIPGGVPKRPGLKHPMIGAPGELHEFLDAVVDAARKQGARVQISVDPSQGREFNPLSHLEQMLAGRCPHCRGQHG